MRMEGIHFMGNSIMKSYFTTNFVGNIQLFMIYFVYWKSDIMKNAKLAFKILAKIKIS